MFSIPGLTFEQGNGGLTRAVVSSPIASGELFLQGAHVSSWSPTGHRPVLWLSQKSNYEKEKPIRGGVPICFPWFGTNLNDSTAPAHGAARLIDWQVIATDLKKDGAVEINLQGLVDPFVLSYRVEFGRGLKLTLKAELSANATSRQAFEDALHTYFAVSDIRSVTIAGLENTAFIDKVEGALLKPASGAPIEFSGETDRVYVNARSDCILIDNDWKRVIRVAKSGSVSTVVWNPWIDKSKRMSDFGDDEWPKMVCIETANVAGGKIELSPGESHSTTAIISVETQEKTI
ncbi:MAG TPA: D-hexose-6-phosphate mutarotase [Pirellula sp.]|nr:D-hexose-6-phosphate mutarotase [Pirellula sp.]